MYQVFNGVKRVIFAPGSISVLPEELKALGVGKALLIVDKGIRQTGILDRVEALLSAAGIGFSTFDGVEPEPAMDVVDAGVRQFKENGCDAVVGLGGGSAMDSAKGIVAVADNGGTLRDFVGVNKVGGRSTKLVQVPTTAGTGSEVTLGAIFSDKANMLKIGVVSHHLLADTAIVDPELSYSMPQFLAACTGLDALIHALESFISVNSTPFTDVFAYEGIKLLTANLVEAHRNAGNEYKDRMSLGSLLAGMSMANAGGAAVHAFAYPVGGRHHVAHGLVNAILLVPVMKFNLGADVSKLARAATAMGIDVDGLTEKEAAAAAVRKMGDLCRQIGLDKKLRDIGVVEGELETMARDVLLVTRLLKNNPRQVDFESAYEIYKEAF